MSISGIGGYSPAFEPPARNVEAANQAIARAIDDGSAGGGLNVADLSTLLSSVTPGAAAGSAYSPGDFVDTVA